MKEEARRIKEFQERVRLQEEEEARQELLKREKLERQRLNEQYQRDMAERRRAQASPSNRMNVDGPPAAPSIDDRLNDYEKRWDILTQKGARDLRFSDMPWPVLCDMRDLSALTPANIEPFVAHSLRLVGPGENTLKQLIKSDLLMWHPDRFTKYRKRIVQLHWPMVQEGVNIVTEVLINMKKDLTRFA
ncbi:hypothetical protein FA13DRAFT_1628699 [Coprinellus micaceus]|uniref:Uncharacterized protein n=1 Tax=Coprinellus micaceus TaxID=71717 RepID=A0A4Y7TCF5_COPMI|nr:hypothetical protein FA13DRAFT_1628699 [Coprinellus micaceus]